MSAYWIIDQDLLGIPPLEKGTMGPGRLRARAVDNLLRPDFGHVFRMGDDDGVVYYQGRCSVVDDFAPLDDFGMPDSGCTWIEYKNKNGEWERL